MFKMHDHMRGGSRQSLVALLVLFSVGIAPDAVQAQPKKKIPASANSVAVTGTDG